MPHQVKSWYGSSVLAVASHQAVEGLAQKWLQIKTERDPVLADFWHAPDDGLADWAMLFLKGETDYVYLHHGRALAERIGFSMQGRTLSELRTRVRDSLREAYDRATGEFALGYIQSFADFQHEVVLWGRLLMPLRASVSDPRVMLLLYCHPIDDKLSIFKALFERSHSGVLITAPIKDDTGAVVDAWIVAQNDAASRFTGIVDHATSRLQLRSTVLFEREDIWTHLIADLARGEALAHVDDPKQGVSLDIQAELVDEYLVLRLTEASAKGEAFTLAT